VAEQILRLEARTTGLKASPALNTHTRWNYVTEAATGFCFPDHRSFRQLRKRGPPYGPPLKRWNPTSAGSEAEIASDSKFDHQFEYLLAPPMTSFCC